MVKAVRDTQKMLGEVSYTPKSGKQFARSLYVVKDIKKGEKFSEANLICKRPEGGISPIYWNHVVGKKSKQNFKIDDSIYLK